MSSGRAGRAMITYFNNAINKDPFIGLTRGDSSGCVNDTRYVE